MGALASPALDEPQRPCQHRTCPEGACCAAPKERHGRRPNGFIGWADFTPEAER